MSTLFQGVRTVIIALFFVPLMACSGGAWSPNDPDSKLPSDRDTPCSDTSWHNNQYDRFFKNDAPYQEQQKIIHVPKMPFPKPINTGVPR